MYFARLVIYSLVMVLSLQYTLWLDGLSIHVQRKPIKHLYIRIKPPHAEVKVSVPQWMTQANVEQALWARVDWIRAKQSELRAKQRELEAKTAPLCSSFEDGEQYPLWGQFYPLVLQTSSGRALVRLEEGHLILSAKSESTSQAKAKAMDEFYRGQIEERLPALISYWQPLMGVRCSATVLRKMKSRWGSCNVQTGRICLNLQLAKAAPECLEYVLVHELAHLLEPSHNARFKGFMTRFLPDWPARKALLRQVDIRS